MNDASTELQALIDNAKSKMLDNNILRIEATAKTPFVYLNSEDGIFIIKGRGIPENTIEFFKPIVEFIECNFYGLKNYKAYCQFEYYNSDVGKYFIRVLKKLESIYKRGVNVELYWYYEKDDEDMLEEGEYYELMISVPMKFIEYTED
jgi:hypothetical protein